MPTRASNRRLSTLGLLALPAAAIAVNLVVWGIAVSRSGFFADDFLNLTHFYQSLGSLSNDQINTGKYVINVYWAFGTEAFGTSSVVPFLLLDTLVFAGGTVLWLRAGTNSHWASTEAWWIAALFSATAAWFGTALWSSNITHAAGYLALGCGLWAHERCLTATTRRSAVLWSLASGLAWLLAVVSNLLYLGLLVIALYCVVHQVLKLRQFGVPSRSAALMTGAWGLLLPVIYFATVAYPATTAHGPYSHNGLSFVRRNLHYYKSVLAPTGVLQALYLVLAILALAAAVRAARDRDYFPLAVLGAAGATLMPALLQGQQQNIYYVAMPLLLLFSSLGAGVRSALGQRPVHPRTAYVALAVATVGLVLVFVHAGDNRNAIMQSPFGRTLASFRSQVASLVPADSSICAKLDMSAPQQQGFIADMSGTDGFLVPPINAGQAQLMASGLPPCSPGDASITVRLNPRGDFVASG